jgi:hypothetical protein
VQQTSARHRARITTNRLTFATFPVLGYALTADDRGIDTVPQTRLWEIATYDLKPPLNRVDGVSTVMVQGGQVPEFHIVPEPRPAPGSRRDAAGSGQNASAGKPTSSIRRASTRLTINSFLV